MPIRTVSFHLSSPSRSANPDAWREYLTHILVPLGTFRMHSPRHTLAGDKCREAHGRDALAARLYHRVNSDSLRRGERSIDGGFAAPGDDQHERHRDRQYMILKALACLRASPVHEEAVVEVHGRGDEHVDRHR